MSRTECGKQRRPAGSRAFTLLELLTVIAIIGILAAIAMPVISRLKPTATAAAIQQMMTAVGHARQLAISQRTTVYMVFVSSNFWNDPAYSRLPSTERAKAERLLDKQLVGYNFVSLRSVGDQPGNPVPRYWSQWRTLPEGTFIPFQKFIPYNASLPVMTLYTNINATESNLAFQVYGFQYTNGIPFPSEYSTASNGFPYVPLPFIAFDYLGRLVDAKGNPTHTNALIPLALGAVSVPRNADKTAAKVGPGQPSLSITESPVGNSINSFNLINIDWLTGRARIEHQQIL